MMCGKPIRKNPRLNGWDYSRGGTYFITFCTSGMCRVLADIRRGDLYGRPPVHLTPLGECTFQALEELFQQEGIRVEHQVIMPNHVHLLLTVERATTRVAPTVGAVVGRLKSRTVYLAAKRGLHAAGLWQRGYYDHIVRDEADFLRIWRYIDTNPQKWELDCYY